MPLPRLVTTALAVFLVISPAAAQTSDSSFEAGLQQGPESKGVSAWGILGYGNGIGVGGRYMTLLVPEGFLKHERIKDQLAVEFGIDLLHFSYGFLGNNYGFMEILPVAGILWNVWMTDQLALYPKLDLGYAIGFFTGWEDAWGNRPSYGGFFWQTSVGALYKLESVSLRIELGNGLLKAGVGFGF